VTAPVESWLQGRYHFARAPYLNRRGVTCTPDPVLLTLDLNTSCGPAVATLRSPEGNPMIVGPTASVLAMLRHHLAPGRLVDPLTPRWGTEL
jgi:hypothetical protein